MQKSLLVIFARAPVYGRVKQRLAIKLGKAMALAIHNRLLEHTLDVADKSGILYKVYLSEEPKSKQPFPYELQSGANLGERMNKALTAELEQYPRVCLIGSDCLALSVTDIAEAFTNLDSADVVLGPANDGGYYLIGMKMPYPKLFSEITWGTSSVLADTLNKCTNSDLLVHQLRWLNDIDHPEDVPASWL